MRRAAAIALLLGAAITIVPASPALARKADKAQAELAGTEPAVLEARAVTALRAGDSLAAIPLLTELAARQPLDARSQTMLALAWQLRGNGDSQAADMALAGYDLAIRAEPGQFWPSALAGRTAFDQGRYGAALEHFSRAALIQPADARILAGVAAAAYLDGDAALAHAAAARAVKLDQAPPPALLRMAAILAQASGASPDPYLSRLPSTEADALRPRLTQISQTAQLDQSGTVLAEADPAQEAAPQQISLDVAILLSQNTERSRTGFNLLDGLSLQYGASRQATRQIAQVDTGPRSNSYQRVITGSISIPQLNYNLNLFNRGGQRYTVVARPQLSAYLGSESEFFVGRSMKVAVSGVNLGSLEQIDIGIEMKVTPIEVTETGTKVRIEVGRSFLTADPAGNFAEAITTFRQKVAATAEIRFGQTLLLSGLSETVRDKTFSKTPGLGDVPLLGLAFNERNETTREDPVMVLVTRRGRSPWPASPLPAPNTPRSWPSCGRARSIRPAMRTMRRTGSDRHCAIPGCCAAT
ncbi:MAG: secretion protein [Novosphingobium sp.]|nr:secretion protein [Novosphingobium sp.]